MLKSFLPPGSTFFNATSCVMDDGREFQLSPEIVEEFFDGDLVRGAKTCIRFGPVENGRRLHVIVKVSTLTAEPAHA